MSILNTYKPTGVTPLRVIEKIRNNISAEKDEKMTYAGRLDPLAEGVLLILSGEDRFNKPHYLGLDKVYTAWICFGVATDTHDALGLVERYEPPHQEIEIKKVFNTLEGKNLFKYPAFSSYKIQGKPLFMWAKEGRLDEIKRPLTEMNIHSIRVLDKREIPLSDFVLKAKEQVNSVDGDFRQTAILERWGALSEKPPSTLSLYKIRVHCESGTYIRTLSHEAGRAAGCPAFLWHLKRDRVGEFHSSDSLHVW